MMVSAITELIVSLKRFLKVVKTNKKEGICDRDHMWPLKPQIFTIWLFTEKVCCPLVTVNASIAR